MSIRERLGLWLAQSTIAELQRENRAYRARIHNLRDAVEQCGWRARMNSRLPDNAAIVALAADAVTRDLKADIHP